MEMDDPQEAAPTPVEAKPAPSFARLTDLMDGSPLKSGPAQEEPPNGRSHEDSSSGQSTTDKHGSRSRHKSHEPEYNPWDA